MPDTVLNRLGSPDASLHFPKMRLKGAHTSVRREGLPL